MKVIVLFLCFFTSNVMALNWNKCKGNFNSGYLGVLSTAATSASQFISSTGDCAMIGMASHDKKVFVAQNHEHLKVDIARGRGEYLSTYAELSSCTKDASKKLAKDLKNNFEFIYGKDGNNQPKQAYEAMETVIQSNPTLLSECKGHS